MMSVSESPRRPRVFAIEDEPAIRRFYQRFFETHDYELTLAPTGDSALEILQSGEDFDVILLDIRLPGVSGRELWKWLEMERPALCGRVIFVTGDILGESTQRLLQEVGRPYLEKPFSTPDLLKLIDSVRASGGEGSGHGRCVGE